MTKEIKIAESIFESKDVNNEVRNYIFTKLNNNIFLRTDTFLTLVNNIKSYDIFDYEDHNIRVIKDTRVDGFDDDDDPIYKSVYVNLSLTYKDNNPLIAIHRAILNHFLDYYEFSDDCINYSESLKYQLRNDFDVDSIKDILGDKYDSLIVDLYIEFIRFFKVLLIIRKTNDLFLKLNKESRKIVSETINLITNLHFYNPFIHMFTANANTNRLDMEFEFNNELDDAEHLEYIDSLSKTKDGIIELIIELTSIYTDTIAHLFYDKVYNRVINSKFEFLESKLGELLPIDEVIFNS
jgi:hypothetical protein